MKFRSLALPLLIILAASVLPASAGAAKPATGKWTGTKVQLGSNFSFEVKKNRVVKVTATLLETCTGSSYSSYTTFAPKGGWKIRRNGTFSGVKKEKYGALTIYYTFKGRFTSKRRATGKMRQESVITGTRCDTGELKWSAKR